MQNLLGILAWEFCFGILFGIPKSQTKNKKIKKNQAKMRYNRQILILNQKA